MIIAEVDPRPFHWRDYAVRGIVVGRESPMCKTAPALSPASLVMLVASVARSMLLCPSAVSNTTRGAVDARVCGGAPPRAMLAGRRAGPHARGVPLHPLCHGAVASQEEVPRTRCGAVASQKEVPRTRCGGTPRNGSKCSMSLGAPEVRQSRKVARLKVDGVVGRVDKDASDSTPESSAIAYPTTSGSFRHAASHTIKRNTEARRWISATSLWPRP